MRMEKISKQIIMGDTRESTVDSIIITDVPR